VTMSFKGAIKYTIYAFIGLWMFLLGIMVGRGTAPVSFETRSFQERLQAMVRKAQKNQVLEDTDKKIALHYFEALNAPVKPDDMQALAVKVVPDKQENKFLEAKKMQAETTDTRDPHAPETTTPDPAPVKTSKKAATFKASATARDDVAEKKPAPASGTGGEYTIQVAAFKSFKDAVTQTAVLDEKGFTAMRTSKKIDGVTWYRVRVGAFATRDAARRYLEKLNQAGINGMIIKKE
jgi:cell division protein FtsN